MTNTDPVFVTFREVAMIVGMKYKAIIKMMTMNPAPPAAAAAPMVLIIPPSRVSGRITPRAAFPGFSQP
jgi:hypothetical protein